MIQLEIYFGKTLINPMFEKNILLFKNIEHELFRFFRNREKSKFKNKLRFQYIGSFLRNKNTQIPIFNVDDNYKISNSERIHGKYNNT